ncbi:MAG: hypothetical protein PWR13_691 [Archaeoglobi archaeon]|nr:hypothetical protein [Archaeoglobi archaeon]MDK2781663.1 hypothetical protein [Archaeoglobi archaeon]
MNIEEEIRRLEEELKRTPYNKATQHHIGRLKARIAQLRRELERKSSKGSQRESRVKKQGDATVALIGGPSVGKSTLFNALTNANSEVGDYDFTTLEAIPGMMEYNKAKIQILDLPGIIEGASSGRGGGREIISMVRVSDLILFVVEPWDIEKWKLWEKELHECGIRVNRSPPDIKIRKLEHGGIKIQRRVKTKLSDDEIMAVLREFRIHNAEVSLNEDCEVEDLIDVLAGNRKYVRALVVVNKIDLQEPEERNEDYIYVSAKEKRNIEELKKRIYDALELIRVYLKPAGGKADMNSPMILKKGSTVEDVAERLHRDFVEKFRYAMVWGSSVKYPGQRVGKNHVLHDGDIVTIVTEK